MRKETSTNLSNEQLININCGIAYTLSLIGGRWKPSILARLLAGKVRYSDLKRSITNVSERILILQLRELEKDGLVKRTVYPQVPPKVEYELTETGLSMRPLLYSLSEWGNQHKQDIGMEPGEACFNQAEESLPALITE